MADCEQCAALRAEVDNLKSMVIAQEKLLRSKDAENDKLLSALHEAADELDGYYRAEYCGDHPYSKRKLAEAMRQNPARIAITQEKRDD